MLRRRCFSTITVLVAGDARAGRDGPSNGCKRHSSPCSAGCFTEVHLNPYATTTTTTTPPKKLRLVPYRSPALPSHLNRCRLAMDRGGSAIQIQDRGVFKSHLHYLSVQQQHAIIAAQGDSRWPRLWLVGVYYFQSGNSVLRY